MLTEVTEETLAQIVESVFTTMMDLEVSISETPWIHDGDRLTSFVLLTGKWTGAVLFECNRWQACQFAGRILAMDPPSAVDDDVLDVLGELANVIGGNLKCAMPAGVHLSMPTVMEGSDYGLRICGLQVQERLAFDCADGHFWVSVLSKEGKEVPTWDGVDRRELPVTVDSNEAQQKRYEEAEQQDASAEASIRVGIPLIDKLSSLVGELEITQDEIREFSSGRDDAVLNEKSQRLNLISAELQVSMVQMRLQPIGVVWDKFTRMVRERSTILGKDIQLVKYGAETELDRNILEVLKDPLLQLVRISCDYGIESTPIRLGAGKLAQSFLTLRASHEGDKVSIDVEDDGAGFDIVRIKQLALEKRLLLAEDAEKLSDQEALNFLFEPDFSLAGPIAGLPDSIVEMGLVRSQVERIGGAVEVFTRRGKGTTFKILVPRRIP